MHYNINRRGCYKEGEERGGRKRKKRGLQKCEGKTRPGIKKKENMMIMVMIVKNKGDTGRRRIMRYSCRTVERNSDVAVPRDICVFGANGSANNDCE